MKNAHCTTWNMAKKREKRGKGEMDTLGPGIWRKILKNFGNEKCTLQDLVYDEKTEKH